MITKDIDLLTVAPDRLYPEIVQIVKYLASRWQISDPEVSDTAQEAMLRIFLYQKEGFPSSLNVTSAFSPAAVVWSIVRFEVLRGLRNGDRYRLSKDAENTDGWMDALVSDEAQDAERIYMDQQERGNQAERCSAAQHRLEPHVSNILKTVSKKRGASAGEGIARKSSTANKPRPSKATTRFEGKINRLPFSKEELASMLDISLRTLRYYAKGTREPDALTAASLDALVHEHAGQSWERVFSILERSGVPRQNAEQWLQVALNVSERTLKRWMQGGYGAAKGLSKAMEKAIHHQETKNG